MAFTNFDTKEINCKVLYFGPRFSGKTTNLRSIYKNTSYEIKSGLMEFEEEQGPTRFFDFLPVSLGQIKDFHIKLHLYTLPTNSLYQSVTSVILKGIDGFIFVADSRVEAMADNISYLLDIKKILTEEGCNFPDVPKVFQYNKRDLENIVPVEILRQELNPAGVFDSEAVAIQSKGTMETLQAIAKQMLKKLNP